MRYRITSVLALGCMLAAAAGAAPTFDASLKDADAKAKKAEATVEIKVTDIQLIDPASVGEKPQAGQGHLHYKVDDGPVIATTAPKLSFHELTRGDHRFELTLVGNDHKPLLPSKTLKVTIPSDAQAQR